MSDIELYLKTKQVELNEYETKLKELKSSLSSYDKQANVEINRQIKTVESKIKDGKSKLEALRKSNKAEIDSHKESIDDAFRSIYTHLVMS